MTNSSNFLETILNLEILFNFSVQVLRFTQTSKNTVYKTRFPLLNGPKTYVLNFNFRENSLKFERSLKLHLSLIFLQLAYVSCKVITYGYHLSQDLPSKVSHFHYLPVFMLKL